MRKTYMSLAVSRAWSADMPIGDPTGGPAYGERNMPLVAVAAAAYAAGTIATVGIAAMSALEIISAVGAIASGIGVVTGNEKLAKIGGIIGLAGGVGAFAQNQGWLAGASDMAKTGTEVATSAATQGTQASNVVDAAGGNIAEIAQGGADVGKAVDAASATANVDKVAEAAQNGGLMAPKVDGALQAPSATPDQIPGPLNEASKLVQQQGIAQAGGDLLNTNLPTQSTSGGFLDAFSGIGKWMEDNKTMATIGSQAIGGMFDKDKAAKSDYYNAETDMLRQQMNNMSRMPIASIMQPTMPTSQVTPKTGLMNTASYKG